MRVEKEDKSLHDKYDEFREALVHLHRKEMENPSQEHGVQGLWDDLYDSIADDIVYYGRKADLKFIEVIASRMNDEPKYIRERFIKTLGSLGKKRSEVIKISMKPLMECLKDSDFGIEMHASESIAEMAKRSPNFVVPTLIEGLRCSDNQVRKWSAETIGEIAKGDATLVSGSISHLVALLDDPDVGAAINAAEALEAISKKSLNYFEGFILEMRPATAHWNSNVSDKIKRILARLGQLEELPRSETSKGEEKVGDVDSVDVPEIQSDYVFILMSMKEDPFLDDVNEAIRRVCVRLQLHAERVDDIQHSGRITDKIIERIKASRILIADLTHESPNVYYELGFAHGFNREVVLIAKKETKLHFDVKDFNVLFYRNVTELESKLRKRLQALLGILT